MTTPTPEERADDVLSRFAPLGDFPAIKALITSALREADAAGYQRGLEEAAKKAYHYGAEGLAIAIRNLMETPQ